MNPSEASKKYWQELKGQPLKKKLEHIFTYYWTPIVIVLGLIIILSWYISEQVNRKDPALFGYCINGIHYESVDEQFPNVYAQYAGIDANENEVSFVDSFIIDYENYDESTYNNIQTLFAHIAAEQLDFTISGSDIFIGFAYSDSYIDLRSILTPEQLERFDSMLIYVDQAVLDTEDQTAIDHLITNMDPTDPSTMTDPVPVGVIIPEDSILREYYAFTSTDLVYGIIKNTLQPENSLKLLEMLTQ